MQGSIDPKMCALNPSSRARRRLFCLYKYLMITACIVTYLIYPLIPFAKQASLDPHNRLSTDSANPEWYRLPLTHIPAKIWQVLLGPNKYERLEESVQSWVLHNRNMEYTLLNDEGAMDFVRYHYAGRTHILNTFLDLRVHVLRADLLRYMILESQGGVYSDIDAPALKPISKWVPAEFQDKTKLIVGIEYDQLEGQPSHGFTKRISLCQWTIAASKSHPVIRGIVEAVVETIQRTALSQNVTAADLQIHDQDVGDITGPGIWTEHILSAIKVHFEGEHGVPMTHGTISGLQEPKLFGDILVLPIDAFGTGQAHSGSGEHPEKALVRHQWAMAWRAEGW